MAPAYSKFSDEPNPRHRAPIPLFPKVDVTEKATERIKVKLRRNPATATPVYDKEYILVNVHTAEAYCQFRKTFAEYETFAPLNSAVTKFNGATQLLTGDSRDTWNAIIATKDQQSEEDFLEALDDFAITIMGKRARKEQIRFMRHDFGKPNKMAISSFYTRLQVMRGYLPFLTGPGGEMTDGDLAEIFVHALPRVFLDAMIQADFEYDEKPLGEVFGYLSRLEKVFELKERILSSYQANNNNQPRHSHKKHTAKPHSADGQKPGAKIKCSFCQKPGHTEDKCWKKQRSARKKTVSFKTAEAHNMHAVNVDSDDELTERLMEELNLNEK
jgi:hypothetical protein